MAAIVVPCGMSNGGAPPDGTGAKGSSPTRRSTAVKLGPGSSVGPNMGRLIGALPATGRAGSLTALLDVAADELLRVLLEDLVDLVQKIVELGLELLALLARRRDLVDRVFFCSAGGLLLDLFSFWHPGLFLLRAQPLEQLGGAGHATQQFFDVGLGSSQGLHHRYPPERVAAEVEHQRIPVGGGDRARPPLEALASEVGPGG